MISVIIPVSISVIAVAIICAMVPVWIVTAAVIIIDAMRQS